MPDQDDNPLAELNDDKLPVQLAKDTLEREFERPRGIFTQTDRQFLSGFKEYEHIQSESNRRQDIRGRVIQAFHDFRLLSWISEKDRITVFDEMDPDELRDCLVSLFAFVYRGTDRDRESIEQMIQRAIFRVEAEESQADGDQEEIADVSVNIDIDRGYDAEKVYERFQQGPAEHLTPAEIGMMVRAGVLNEDDISRLSIDSADNATDSGSPNDTP